MELELNGCNKEAAALHNDGYTQVRLYYAAVAKL